MMGICLWTFISSIGGGVAPGDINYLQLPGQFPTILPGPDASEKALREKS